MTRRRRTLTKAEEALWRAAMRDATPARPSAAKASSEALSGASSGPAPDVAAQFNAHFESQHDARDETDAEPDPLYALARPRAPARGVNSAAAPQSPARAAADPPPPVLTPLTRGAPGLDRRTAERLRKGERVPDARIDLHGMTLERAHAALLSFIQGSRAQGLRCVLVITGKGGDYRRRAQNARARYEMEERRGAIKESAPRWMEEAAFRRHVSGLYPAHPRHGGEGALYVYLRKSP